MTVYLTARLHRLEQRASIAGPPGHVCITAIERVIVTPLDYMLAVMRDEQADVRRRDDMAKAAAPYVHPRMTPAQPSHPDPDFVPLHERIKAYAREKTIQATGQGGGDDAQR